MGMVQAVAGVFTGGKGLLRIAFAVALALLLPAPAGWAADPGLRGDRPVVVGINRDFAPYEFLDARGEPAGYDVDLIRAVAAEVGLVLRFKAGSWTEIRADLEAGRIDALAGMLYSEARSEKVDFGPPHLAVHYAMFVRKGALDPANLEALRGLTVLVERGSMAQEALTARGFGPTLLPAASEPEALALLAQGRGEAAVVPRLLGLSTARDRHLDNVHPAGEPVLALDLCFAVRKGDKAVLDALNTGLAILNSTGVYRRIHTTWFGYGEPDSWLSPLGWRIAGWIALAVLLLSVHLLGWSWSLKKQVHQRTQALAEATRAMAEKERFLATVVEAVPLALFGKDPRNEFRITLWNAKAEEIFGISREGALGRNDFELFPRDQAEARRRADLEVLAQGRTLDIGESPGTSRTAGPTTLRTLKTPVLDAEGRPCLLLGMTENITERKAMERDLRQSRASLAKAQALAGIGNWEWDPATGELTWSDQLFRNLGLEPGASRPCYRAALARIHPEDRRILRGSLQRLHDPRMRLPVDLRAVLPSGQIRILHSTLEVERDQGGRVTRLLGTLQDLTESRSTEEAFRQAQKLESLGVLAGGLAHDFNNLLSAIGGNLELAQMNMGPEPAAGLFLNRIEKILRRASQLTHQMLAYSGKGRFVVKPLNLNQVAEEMPHLLEVSISKRVVLDYQFEPRLPAIDADAAQIQQVIMNLVTNASEAIGDRDGRITLKTGREFLADPQGQVESRGWMLLPGLYVTLEVVDTGCGMDEETRLRLFDPFFTTKFSGRGLGLSAMLGILKAHNAGIRIQSKVGAGSSFKLFFPASAVQGVPEPAPEPLPSVPGPTGNILVVDDEPDVRETVAELLGSLGYRTLEARDGLDALERFEADGPDIALVIMDLTMPRMDGREAVARMRLLDPEVRVILCSGFNEADATRGFPEVHHSGFLQKPFTFQNLKDAVRMALAT